MLTYQPTVLCLWLVVKLKFGNPFSLIITKMDCQLKPLVLSELSLS